jgi:hypothetical protein
LCVNKSQFVPVIFEPPCISFHGGWGEESAFIFSTYSDQKLCMILSLHPSHLTWINHSNSILLV